MIHHLLFYIQSHAFEGCSSLSEIEIPSSAKMIGTDVLNGVKLINIKGTIKIPSSMTSIGCDSFSCCSSLTKVLFEPPSSLKSIIGYSFSFCTSLIELEIHSSVKECDYGIVEGCTSLLYFKIPSTLYPFYFENGYSTIIVAKSSKWL